jgi:membrane-bound ClpP family serine protease
VHASDTKEKHMITLGIILLVIGLLVASLHVLFTIGVVLLVVGVILAILGRTGRAVAGRKHWW